MTTAAAISKFNPGEYEVGLGERTVRVWKSRRGWIAAANWDRHLLTDVLPTKREAVFNAEAMLRQGGE